MELLYILLVLLVLTRAFGELAVRLRQPALVGELISGILLGVIAHRYSGALPVLSGLTENEVFVAVTDLGVFFLMLLAGIEMHPGELAKGSAGSFFVAVGGMVVPFALGLGLGHAFLPASDYRSAQVLFVGTSMAITAVPVTIRVLMDLKKLDTRMGQTIVSAALFDDVLSLILLAVLTALIKTGQMPAAAGILQLAGEVLLFFGITAALGLWLLPRLDRALEPLMGEELEFSGLLIVAFAFSVLAELLGLHFILGAFVAGLFFSRRKLEVRMYEDVKQRVSGLTTGFLAPVFFASIGLHLQLDALVHIPGFLALFILCAVLGKLLGAGLPARMIGMPRREAAMVGVAMSGRATVELVIAGIALKAGLFSQPDPTPDVVTNLFSAVVIMAVCTTLLVPVVLRALASREPANGEPGAAADPEDA